MEIKMSCVFECDRLKVVTKLERSMALSQESRVLEFVGEGSFSQVWGTENYVFKIPTITNNSISSSSVFRDVFFQTLCGNHWIELGTGWVGQNKDMCVPVSVSVKMSPIKVSTVVNMRNLIHWLVTDMHRIWLSGVRHGDIKPANICGIMGTMFRFIDFGNASSGNMPHLTPPSNGFRAPEIDAYDKMTNQSEVWSLGSTVACIFTKRYLFSSLGGWIRVLNKVISTAEISNPLVADFLKDTMDPDPHNRLNISQLVLKYGSIETTHNNRVETMRRTSPVETSFINIDYPDLTVNMTAGQLEAAQFLNNRCQIPMENAIDTIFSLINGYTRGNVTSSLVKGMVDACNNAHHIHMLINSS